MIRGLIAAEILLTHGQPAGALLLWNWSYSGAGVSASGTFTTNDAPDGAGYYQIVGITGTDNGAAITVLQPTGRAIPGNEPYAVDNQVSAAEPHLTTLGFGFCWQTATTPTRSSKARAATSTYRYCLA